MYASPLRRARPRMPSNQTATEATIISRHEYDSESSLIYHAPLSPLSKRISPFQLTSGTVPLPSIPASETKLNPIEKTKPIARLHIVESELKTSILDRFSTRNVGTGEVPVLQVDTSLKRGIIDSLTSLPQAINMPKLTITENIATRIEDANYFSFSEKKEHRTDPIIFDKFLINLIEILLNIIKTLTEKSQLGDKIYEIAEKFSGIRQAFLIPRIDIPETISSSIYLKLHEFSEGIHLDTIHENCVKRSDFDNIMTNYKSLLNARSPTNQKSYLSGINKLSPKRESEPFIATPERSRPLFESAPKSSPSIDLTMTILDNRTLSPQTIIRRSPLGEYYQESKGFELIDGVSRQVTYKRYLTPKRAFLSPPT